MEVDVDDATIRTDKMTNEKDIGGILYKAIGREDLKEISRILE